MWISGRSAFWVRKGQRQAHEIESAWHGCSGTSTEVSLAQKHGPKEGELGSEVRVMAECQIM